MATQNISVGALVMCGVHYLSTDPPAEHLRKRWADHPELVNKNQKPGRKSIHTSLLRHLRVFLSSIVCKDCYNLLLTHCLILFTSDCVQRVNDLNVQGATVC